MAAEVPQIQKIEEPRMKPLHPHLPFHDDETPLSWVCRLAAFHLGGRPNELLTDRGISLAAVQFGEPEAIRGLAEAGSADPVTVQRNAVEKLPDGRDRVRGETLHQRLVVRRRSMVCPRCLIEDVGGGQPDTAALRGRFSWQFSVVAVCPTHRQPLFDLNDDANRLNYFPMAATAVRHWDRLTAAAASAAETAPTAVQDYVLARLDGERGPAWLDGQPLDHAAKACEVIGCVALKGPRPNSKRFSDKEWRDAMNLGFEIASGGEVAIRSLLSDLQARCFTDDGHAGPQAMFGSMWVWAAHGDRKDGLSQLEEILRQHIIETMPVGAGEDLLGRPVERRLIHSVRTLTVESGLNPRRLRKLLEARGLIRPEHKDLPDNRAVFDADAGDAIAHELLNGIPLAGLPDYLGVTKTFASLLVGAGLVEATIEPASEHELGEYRFDRAALDLFLEKLLAGAVPVDEAPPGFFSIRRVAAGAQVKFVDVVAALAAGHLTQRRLLTSRSGIGALLLHREEARAHFQPDRSKRDYALYRAADRLKTTERVIAALIRDRPGGPILATCPFVNTRGENSIAIPYDALEAFDRTYVSATNLARELGRHPVSLVRTLASLGVAPCFDEKEIMARFYRRTDIPPGV